MSIWHGLLALLERGPGYGAWLRAEPTAGTGAVWGLNVEQVHTTLARLERDGLIMQQGRDARGRPLYALTAAGRTELHDWYTRPVEWTSPPHDELAIKLTMAVGAPGVDVRTVLEVQRRHLREALREYTRQRCEILAEPPVHRDEVTRLLGLEQRVLHTEAELLWLDHCEIRLQRLASAAATEPPAATESPDAPL
ncbi:PadR family transcriptional regulator [Streptomyces hygroscopicus]|uniref:PadR family transcriptional regulator n=1 Tax=Streptomyces hygroscopicus TaxID=1912 RepID=UPI002240045A|nr:helix-turn-helix transcriptional regulator [Streptomyces hygroscopicus]MCW7941797.1 PadR family transcriptional regulator [Streptomyces hygroscopicus]